MATGWTPERRARQAEMIRSWRPWEKSTGPRTADGKATASRNGDKGGAWREERDQLRALKSSVADLLMRQREMLRRVGGQLGHAQGAGGNFGGNSNTFKMKK